MIHTAADCPGPTSPPPPRPPALCISLSPHSLNPQAGEACGLQYTSQDVGRRVVLPAGAAPINLLFIYEPLPTAARRRGPLPSAAKDRLTPAAGLDVDLYVVHSPSFLVVLLVALGALSPLPCCVYCGRRHALHKAAHPLTKAYWLRHPSKWRVKHPRWANPWKQVGLLVGLHLIAGGLVWYLALGAMTDGADPSFPVALLGLALAALGAALLAAAAVWALRDDMRHAPYRCPICERAVAPWRVVGTYLPSDGPPLKAHTRCLRCCRCRRPVVVERWAEGPAHRPYHDRCWAEHCAAVCTDLAGLAAWCAQDPSDVELVHLLAATIKGQSPDAMRALLDLWPDLDLRPLPGAPTAWHCAAAAGNLPQLRALLQRRGTHLDVWPEYEEEHDCFLVQGLGHQDDLYVRQPPLSYNCRPVYVGMSFVMASPPPTPAPKASAPLEPPTWPITSPCAARPSLHEQTTDNTWEPNRSFLQNMRWLDSTSIWRGMHCNDWMGSWWWVGGWVRGRGGHTRVENIDARHSVHNMCKLYNTYAHCLQTTLALWMICMCRGVLKVW